MLSVKLLIVIFQFNCFLNQDIKPEDIGGIVTSSTSTSTASSTGTEKPPDEHTKLLIKKESLHISKDFVNWLVSDVKKVTTEEQTYDGWYNNPSLPSIGATGNILIRLLPPAYDDGIQKPFERKEVSNPLHISEKLTADITQCKTCENSCSGTGKNVLMVFFGQFVTEEILNTRNPSCPPEYFNIKIPTDHEYSKVDLKTMPFIRTRYDKKSGISPNNPRELLNSATAWIDGSVIYGSSKAWAESLRLFQNGQLASNDTEGLYPALNAGYLSFLNPQFKLKRSKREKNFRIGNRLGHENPYVLSFSILFFRWHNILAKTLCRQNADWKDEDCYVEARKWVIATLQHIIIDEWLPELLGVKLKEYKLYDPSIDPRISNAFQSAAMRFLHTLIPSAVYYWKPLSDCDHHAIRICHSVYKAKDIIDKYGIEALLLGMTFQAAEKEDIHIVDDIRRYLYGPPEFSSRDLMSLNIQRGRDHGVPGYGIARKYLLPNETLNNFTFEELTLKFDPEHSKTIKNTLRDFYSSPDDIDLLIGGLLEADNGPGPVFKEIILEQFRRIRDGDRFWYENKANGLFSDKQIQRIKSVTMYDVIMAVAKDLQVNDLPKEVFHVPVSNKVAKNFQCYSKLKAYNCSRSKSVEHCLALQPLSDLLMCETSNYLQECYNAEVTTYDYFSGSGATIILSFLFLFLFIVGCVLLLFVLVNRRQREEAFKLHMRKAKDMKCSDENSVFVMEWNGKKEGTRQVVVHFNPMRKFITIHLLGGQLLRCVDMNKIQILELQVSTGGNQHFILIRIAREYDMVWKFETEEERADAIEKLESFCGSIGVGRTRTEVNLKDMLKNAVTKTHRKIQLEKFFRVVFAQAFSIKHDEDEEPDLNSDHVREIINTELTPYEFAEALSVRPDALFVKQMFELVDADGNGYISFREFLNMIIIFAKGSPEDKMKLMFDIYDIDHSGKLTRDEFSNMIRSLLELANQSLSSQQLDQLVSSMFKTAGLQNKPEITLQDFSQLLAGHREELGYVQLSFDVGKGFKTGPVGAAENRKSAVIRAQESILKAYSDTSNIRREAQTSMVRIEAKPNDKPYARNKQNASEVIRFMENYNRHIFWALLYTLIIFGIFIEKAYYYSVESEHSGLRRIAGYGVTVTRGAASVMMFTYSTILLTMCRNIITFLRETFLHKYVPFDAAIAFHKFIAFWALIFTIIHAIGHAINFYHISTQTPSDLQCLFNEFHLVQEKPPKFYYWCFETITGTTGVLLVIVLSLLYVFAVQYARRHVFNAFWQTHNLYPILYILTILHGLGRLVQQPIFYCYFIGPMILFTIDRLISVSRKKVEISVVRAELLPSDVIHLEFKRPANFEYLSGQWVRIACIPLNENEYHPFTLSSAPHEENLSLHIRAVGPWTTNLRNIYDPNNLHQHAYPKIYLDGPYGEGHQDWFRYEISVLVGGGIGITPFASILKDVVFKSSIKAQIFCKKLYFIWVTRTQKHFEWMTDIIQEVEKSDRNRFVDVHIFITQFYQKFDMRTTMLYICEQHFHRISGRSLFTGLQSTTHFGRPNFETFFESLRQEHSDVNKIAVFSCGPPLMTRSVQSSCDELNKHEGTIFVHHFENF